ncbi:MAG TPA: hypothetical protein VKA95_06720 [Nitrososphaeraceae archaeon]|nr:hypothetical protein [Nitrososphaeraceae archaeon]
MYAQDSSGVTNATVLSGDDASSQSGQLQNQSANYFDGSLGYLVYPGSTNVTGTSVQQQQQKLPAVVMVHEWWGCE